MTAAAQCDDPNCTACYIARRIPPQYPHTGPS